MSPAESAPGLQLSEREFGEIRDILLQDPGFDLARYKSRCIGRRIAKRISARGIGIAEYLQILRTDAAERNRLLATLTIHVSQFFRNPSTFALLEQRILPELVRSRRKIRIWSIGCAGGEEPYSLALLLETLAPELDCSILATDISRPMLEQARQGLFDPLRLTEVPAVMRSRYFFREGRQYRLDSRIRSRVRFACHDIMGPRAFPVADLVLCRNVLIYFARREQEKVLARLVQTLPPGGYLVLGRAESLLGESRRFFASESPAERIYRRLDLPQVAAAPSAASALV